MTIRGSSSGGEWLNKVSDFLESTDTNLDQVKKSVIGDLDKLKKSPDLQNLAANFYASAEKGFRKDLEELGITGKDQAEYTGMFREAWDKDQMRLKSDEILSSPELSAMDSFITDVQNLPKIKALIETSQPQAKWQILLQDLFQKIGIDGKTVKGYLGPLLSTCGLGFLVKEKTFKKTEKEKRGPDHEQKKDEKPPIQKEDNEVFKKPGSTMILGDSINAGFQAKMYDKAIQVEGKKEVLAKGGEQTGWLLRQLKSKPDEYFKGFENAIVTIGTNNLGSTQSAEKIVNDIDEIYEILKRHQIKIYGATIPPGKGNTSGFWGSDFPSVENKRQAVNKKIREAASSGRIYHLIDLAAKEKDGGLADNNDPEKMAEHLRAKGNDPVHPDRAKLGVIYQRELEKGSSKPVDHANEPIS